MKAYILMQHSCDEENIISVYADKRDAEARADFLNSEENPDYWSSDYAYVEEFEVIE